MTTDWIYHILNVGGQSYTSHGVGTTTVLSTVGSLQNMLSGIVQALYPTVIAVVVLFAAYSVVKRLYHSRF